MEAGNVKRCRGKGRNKNERCTSNRKEKETQNKIIRQQKGSQAI